MRAPFIGGSAHPRLWDTAWQAPPHWALTLFRLVCGVGLVLYFLSHYFATPDLIAYHGLYDPQAIKAFGAPVRNAGWLTERSPGALRIVFLFAGVLAALGSAGVFPRASSAVLFVLALLSYRAVLPISHLDDYMATATALWLILLPGPEGHLLSKNYWRWEAAKNTLPGAAFVFVGYAMLLYVLLGLGLLRASGPGTAESRTPLFVLGYCLMPALVVAPGRWPKVAGATLQVLLHCYLAITTGLVVTHLLLCATGFLLWTPAWVRRSELASAPLLRMTVASAAGATYVALFAAVQLGGSLIPTASRSKMARMLMDVGLLPVVSTARPLAGKVGLMLQVPDAADVIVEPNGKRVALLLQELSATSDDPESRLRDDALVRRLLRVSCARQQVAGSGVAAVVSDGAVRKRWSFTCSSATELPATRLL